MQHETDATTPQIRAHPSRDGVQIVDPIQETQFALLTDEPVEPVDCDPDRFYFPADAGATIATDHIETPYQVGAWIRDGSGETVGQVGEDDVVDVSPSRYNIELSTTQMKVQFAVEGGVTVESKGDNVEISVRDTDCVHIGVRSVHEEPAGTVTTTDDPQDVMTAVSTLGSALKTTSCERSFPSLRGHPPLIVSGETLTVPDWIDLPDTDIHIEIPAEFQYIYPVTPLAFYLGATVETGPVPKLVAAEWEYLLDEANGFESTVERVLKQVFLLDCVTRTEGYYRVDLSERYQVEDTVDLDFESLYEQPIAEQVRSYLEVPEEKLAGIIPRWKLTADVRPKAQYASALPFLTDELAVIRCPGSENVADHSSNEISEQVEDIFRKSPSQGLVRGTKTRTARSNTSATSLDQRIVRPEQADSIEQAYVGEGIPVGASKMTIDAYYRRLEYEPSTEPRIRVIVVCNEEEMADENVVSEIYGTRDWIEFDIHFEEHLSAGEMRDVLATDADFLHYIGHVDDEGIRCTDGYLDTRELSEVNVSAFLLNACDSYQQGNGLVNNGAMAGIATVTDVIDKAATSVGRTVAKLLNQGFSLASTIPVIQEYEQIGHHYIALGDCSTSIVENQSGTPHLITLTEETDNYYNISLFGYPTLTTPMGTIFSANLTNSEQVYLNSGKMADSYVSEAELRDFLTRQNVPVEFNGSLQWSNDLRIF